jgi:AcrR family transcriptional regulator
LRWRKNTTNYSLFVVALPGRRMADRTSHRISTRKQPKQARSVGLVADILQAAAQVLAQEGAQRFTTARVAEKAGVSVGSLYQYFPNKASILFRLQTEEWRATAAMLGDILGERTKPPLERLRAAVHAFVHSECEEAEMRLALGDAAPFYRDAPEAQEPRASGARTMQLFVDEVLPCAPAATRQLVGNVIMMTLSAVGKQISEVHQTFAEIETYANAVADMVCAYLESLRH